MLVYLLAVVVIIAVATKIYLVSICGKCTSKRRLDGKTVLLTGGNSGIGYRAAKDIAKRGARLIITSENKEDCIRAAEQLKRETKNQNIIPKYLDFTSLAQVREFAKEFLETEDRLDILVNNAGTAGCGIRRTKDGLLTGLQINYFGPFLLTHLLVDLLKKSKPSRIVNVTSLLSQFSIVDMNNINWCPYPSISDWLVYNNSKLLMVYMTWDFAGRLKNDGVIVNCVHPGAVNTGIFYKVSGLQHILIWQWLPYVLRYTYFKTPEEGAQTTIHVAVSEEVEGTTGKYFADCKPVRPWIKKDLAAMKSVWDQAIKLVKLLPEEIKV